MSSPGSCSLRRPHSSRRRLRRHRDHLAPANRAEHHLELALVPRQQPVDRVLALQGPGLGVDHLAVAEVDRRLLAGLAGEVDQAGLAADLDGLDQVDHRHVADAAGEPRAAVAALLDPRALPLLDQDARAGDDLLDVDRLGQVVLDAQLEALDLGFDLGLRREEHERDVGPLGVGLEALAERVAVEFVEQRLRDHQVGRRQLDLVEGVLAVDRGGDDEAGLLERHLEHAQAARVAVDQEE